MEEEEEGLVSRIIQGKADLGRIRAERLQREDQAASAKAKAQHGVCERV